MSLALRDLSIHKEETKISSNFVSITYIFEGNLSEYNAYTLRNNMEQWLDNGYHEYKLNLRKLNHLDIAGVNFLIQIQEEIVAKGASFSIIVPYKKNVMDVIYLTKLENALHIEPFLDNDFD